MQKKDIDNVYICKFFCKSKNIFCRLMFTTFNSDVRIWNLEKFAPFGRLSAATHGSRQYILTIQITNIIEFPKFLKRYLGLTVL